MLVDRRHTQRRAWSPLAHGWPAVIGLASVSSAEIEADIDGVPESLYRFFAEEVFAALGTRPARLATLSVAPVLDRELVCGSSRREDAILSLQRRSTSASSWSTVSDLGLHPLARAFLEERSSRLGLVPADGASTTCLAHYREGRDWDAAFDLMSAGWPHELEELLSFALDELLAAARLSTLERGASSPPKPTSDAPIFSLALPT